MFKCQKYFYPIHPSIDSFFTHPYKISFSFHYIPLHSITFHSSFSKGKAQEWEKKFIVYEATTATATLTLLNKRIFMNRTMAVHVRYNSWYISAESTQSSAKRPNFALSAESIWTRFLYFRHLFSKTSWHNVTTTGEAIAQRTSVLLEELWSQEGRWSHMRPFFLSRWKIFWNWAFRKRSSQDYHVIFLSDVFFIHKSKITGDCLVF